MLGASYVDHDNTCMLIYVSTVELHLRKFRFHDFAQFSTFVSKRLFQDEIFFFQEIQVF